MELVQRFLGELWFILAESGIWLILGLGLAGLMHAFVPRSWLERQLGGRGLTPILKASALGIPLPLCSCSVIPVAAGLRRGGASKGASAAFAISTPQTGEESIPLTWALFGPFFAFTRPVVAVATAATAGLFIDRLPEPTHARRGVRDAGQGADAGGCCDSNARTHTPPPQHQTHAAACCDSTPVEASCCGSKNPDPTVTSARSKTDRLRLALRHGFGTMLLDLAPWLAVGFLAAAAVAALLPQDWIGTHIPEGPAQIGLALVVGLPLYVCATSSTPLAFTLVAAAGLSPGAALTLLLAGPASNAATMSWVLRDLGPRALFVYLATIALFAAASGLAFDAFFRDLVRLAEHAHQHAHAASLAQTAAAGAFAAMLLGALVWRARGWFTSRGPAREGLPAAAPQIPS